MGSFKWIFNINYISSELWIFILLIVMIVIMFVSSYVFVKKELKDKNGKSDVYERKN